MGKRGAIRVRHTWQSQAAPRDNRARNSKENEAISGAGGEGAGQLTASFLYSLPFVRSRRDAPGRASPRPAPAKPSVARGPSAPVLSARDVAGPGTPDSQRLTLLPLPKPPRAHPTRCGESGGVASRKPGTYVSARFSPAFLAFAAFPAFLQDQRDHQVPGTHGDNTTAGRANVPETSPKPPPREARGSASWWPSWAPTCARFGASGGLRMSL
jgi:hypothetical protein